MSNGTDQAQPPPENTTPPANLKSRKRASPGDDTWLPPGWRTEVKVRKSGTKAGIVDKFYYEPNTNRKFRSKNEVLYYLEHGTPKKPVKNTENGGLHSQNSESPGSTRKQTKPKKKANEQPPKPLNFDFLNVPDKVIWTGTNGSDEAWWPSIGDYKIQESVSRDWDRAFTFVTAQNVDKTTF